MKTMQFKPYAILSAVILILLLAACAPAPAPAPTPEPVTNQYTVIVEDGDGWSTVLGKLGIDPYAEDLPRVVRNGYEQDPTGPLHEDDVVVLAVKPEQGLGTYIATRRVNVPASERDLVSLSGFQESITGTRIESALKDACQWNRWDHFDKSGFNGDLNTGGCNFTTVLLLVNAENVKTCVAYGSAAEAYNAVPGYNLDAMKFASVVITADQLSLDEAVSTYCK